MITACVKVGNKTSSVELITDAVKQDSVFRNIMAVIGPDMRAEIKEDSLAFLILPVQASCPGCRRKTIDSIVAHKGDLAKQHFIIISAHGGKKTINSFFREQDDELPVITNALVLDSNNSAYKYGLYVDKPTIYYAFNKKAYKKVAAIPTTVKEDLREFFSGIRYK